MRFWKAAGHLMMAAAVMAGAACSPTREAGANEIKDPHFLRGQELARQLDPKGAIESFERALETNPRSASAHFELGILYRDEKKGGDAAAAIYHFERFLRLRPNSPHADIVKQHIRDGKVELARSENLVHATPAQQQHFDRYKAEIERLAAENAQLRSRLEQSGQPTPPPASKTGPTPVSPTRADTVAAASPPPKAAAPAAEPHETKGATHTSSARTHTIRQGEYPATIAKQYKLKLDTLLAANPGIDPKRLKIGQTLIIPAP
ncbi:MAG: LysM peptidoglycan-binding domain-containing protein [Verrucomicrobia bacterium]|nr:LysM peptidoglycan-binding domain-containing protein [Verrucomicrobiota bacterium]